jgi:hypothetical protein
MNMQVVDWNQNDKESFDLKLLLTTEEDIGGIVFGSRVATELDTDTAGTQGLEHKVGQRFLRPPQAHGLKAFMEWFLFCKGFNCIY